MEKQRGFVTVATGSDRYYELAANLCRSYKTRGAGEYPFALICDRENEYTAVFDRVVIVEEFTKTTLDKMLMQYSPYFESIFLDADTLILKNIDDLWDVFENQDDVSAFGCTLPLDSQKGWFTYEGSGKYKPQVKYLISMNGGVYYFRKTPKAEQVFRQARELVADYSGIDFKYFDNPQDEPLMAMSMVLNGCHPNDVAYDMIILPAHKRKVTVDFRGNVYEDGRASDMKMIHFSTPKTRLFLYNYLAELLRGESPSRWNCWRARLRYSLRDGKANLLHNGGAVLRRLGMDALVERIKGKRR